MKLSIVGCVRTIMVLCLVAFLLAIVSTASSNTRKPEATSEEDEVRALVQKGETLLSEGRYFAVYTVCDEVVKRFGDASEMEIKGQVAKALFNKGVAFVELGRSDEAFASFCAALAFREVLDKDIVDIIYKAIDDLGRSPDEC